MLNKIMAMEKKVKIINQLAINNYLSRSELVRLTGYPRSTLFDIIKKLKKERIVEQFREDNHQGPGRPVEYYKLVECAD